MKRIEVLLLSGSVGFLIIGIDQTIRLGYSIYDSYWIFMFSILCLLGLYLLRVQGKAQNKPSSSESTTHHPPKR